MRPQDHWESVVVGEFLAWQGTHELLAQVAMNVAWANAQQPKCFGYPDAKFLADVGRGMDALRSAPAVVAALAARHGHDGPVSVDARMTSAGGLRVDANLVSPSPDEPGGWSLGEGVCVASFDGVGRLFEDATLFYEGATEFENAARYLLRSDMARVIMIAWDRFGEILSRSFDVRTRGGPVLREPSDVEAFLLVEAEAQRVERLRREAEAEAAAREAEAAQAAERERARDAQAVAARRVEAQALVDRFQGDVELLILRALATEGPGCGLAVQKAFREAGFEFAPSRSKLKAAEVAGALDLLRPGWRDVERVVEPLPPVQTVRQRQGKDKPRG